MRRTGQRIHPSRLGAGALACAAACGLLGAAAVGQQTAVPESYSSVTNLQFSPNAAASGTLSVVLQEIERILKAEGFEVKADSVEVSGIKPAGDGQLRVIVRLVTDEQPGNPKPLLYRVNVERVPKPDAVTPPGPELPASQLEAERIRGAVIGVILRPAAKAEDIEMPDGQVLLSMPVGSSPGGAEFFDRIVKRVSGINKRLEQEAAVVERRADNDFTIVFDVDKMLAKAPKNIERANKPMPVRVKYTVDPPKGDEPNVRVLVTDLTGGEIDKFPDYRRWATSGPLGLVMGGP